MEYPSEKANRVTVTRSSDLDLSRNARTCVVVLNWNKAELTSRCLDALSAQRAAAFDILVIDNGSSADEVARICEMSRGRCQLLTLSHNRGFAGGMNAGVCFAHEYGYEYVWLLNNDAVPDPDCLRQLISALESDARVAMVTPQIRGLDDEEQHAGARFDWQWATNSPLNSDELSLPGHFGAWLTGTALLCRTKIVSELGGFDERLFAYWEDTDLCFRLGQAEYEFHAVPNARCFHLGGASVGGPVSPYAAYMSARNGWHVLRKFALGRNGALVRLNYVAGVIRVAGECSANGERQRAVAMLAGLRAAILRHELGSPARVPTRPGLWYAAIKLISLHRCRSELNRMSSWARKWIRPIRTAPVIHCRSRQTLIGLAHTASADRAAQPELQFDTNIPARSARARV